MLAPMRRTTLPQLFILALVGSACTPLAQPELARQVGQRAPGFSLPDQTGTDIPLRRLREVGPVVVVFYRGHW